MVGIVDVWKGFRFLGTGDGAASSPGGTEPQSYPSEVAIIQWDLSFHTMRGGIDSKDHRFSPRFVGIIVYGRVLDPRVVSYPSRVVLAPRAPTSERSAGGVGVSTLWGGGFNHGDLFLSPFCLNCR